MEYNKGIMNKIYFFKKNTSQIVFFNCLQNPTKVYRKNIFEDSGPRSNKIKTRCDGPKVRAA